MFKAAEILRELILDFSRDGKCKILNGFLTIPSTSTLTEA